MLPPEHPERDNDPDPEDLRRARAFLAEIQAQLAVQRERLKREEAPEDESVSLADLSPAGLEAYEAYRQSRIRMAAALKAVIATSEKIERTLQGYLRTFDGES